MTTFTFLQTDSFRNLFPAGMLAYSTSKAAVIGLTKTVGKEYAEKGITCNAIAPGEAFIQHTELPSSCSHHIVFAQPLFVPKWWRKCPLNR